jgi:hypothetical protein
MVKLLIGGSPLRRHQWDEAFRLICEPRHRRGQGEVNVNYPEARGSSHSSAEAHHKKAAVGETERVPRRKRMRLERDTPCSATQYHATKKKTNCGYLTESNTMARKKFKRYTFQCYMFEFLALSKSQLHMVRILVIQDSNKRYSEQHIGDKHDSIQSATVSLKKMR